MLRPLSLFVVSALFLIVALSGTAKRSSSGAPIGSTGAPGENTCAKAGCHDDGGAVNSGEGLLRFTIGGAPSHYVPGETYTVEVSICQPEILRFGFALSSLNEKQVSSGTLLVTDEQRNQVLKGAGPFVQREYITYKFAGTNPYSEGTGKWIFKWKAPEKEAGPVHFYLAAVAANNDGTDAGDDVYATTFVFPSHKPTQE